VRARLEAASLLVTVTNTGPGGGGGRVPTGPGNEARGGLGLGLGNTRERLRHTYGPEASLELETLADGGCLVTLLAPLRRGADENGDVSRAARVLEEGVP
jgi:sensor histidine kinase YesM